MSMISFALAATEADDRITIDDMGDGAIVITAHPENEEPATLAISLERLKLIVGTLGSQGAA